MASHMPSPRAPEPASCASRLRRGARLHDAVGAVLWDAAALALVVAVAACCGWYGCAAIPTPVPPSLTCPACEPAPPPRVEVRTVERVVEVAAPVEPCPVAVHFATDSARLSPDAAELLRWSVPCLPASVAVEGHADERGTAEYNLALGWSRASSVAAYLRALGHREQRVQSWGEARSTGEGWEMDRRVEVGP